MQSMQGHKDKPTTLGHLFDSYDPQMLYSNPDSRTELLGRSIYEIPITDFLGSVLQIQLSRDEYPQPNDVFTTTGKHATTLYAHLYRLERPTVRTDDAAASVSSPQGIPKADPVEVAACVAGLGVVLYAITKLPFAQSI
ncbi:hypothetical protein B5M09_005201 [Aphanomyces astaci]|nr:hypothetical protein B5M09_005201 [Aphanomyces astaci]